MPAVRPPISTHRLSRNTIVKTYDDRGTVRLLANSAGQVTDSYECAAFGTLCTPERPLGAPMVSSEGACAAYWKYGRSRDRYSVGTPTQSNRDSR